MGRRARSPVHLQANDIRYAMSTWCRRNHGKPFTVPALSMALGMNPDSRDDCTKIYGGLKYWRDKAVEKFKKMVDQGILPRDADRYQRWDSFLLSYNNNDAYVFLFNRETGTYFQPNFKELEEMDRVRLSRQWHGILTVIDEMIVYDAQLALSDGSKHPVRDLIDAGESVDRLLDHHEKKEKKGD